MPRNIIISVDTEFDIEYYVYIDKERKSSFKLSAYYWEACNYVGQARLGYGDKYSLDC